MLGDLGYLIGWPAIARAIGPNTSTRKAKCLGEAGIIRVFRLSERNPSTTFEQLREDLERAAKGLPPLGLPAGAEDSAPQNPDRLPPGHRRCVTCGETLEKPRVGAPPRRCPKCRGAAAAVPPREARGWKLTHEQRDAIRQSSEETRVLAERYGVSLQAIRRLRSSP